MADDGADTDGAAPVGPGAAAGAFFPNKRCLEARSGAATAAGGGASSEGAAASVAAAAAASSEPLSSEERAPREDVDARLPAPLLSSPSCSGTS